MLKELFKDHQEYHSQLQHDHFIVAKGGGTLYGQYKQSLRELYTRFGTLRGKWHAIQNIEIDIKELDHQLNPTNGIGLEGFEKERQELKLSKHKQGLFFLKKTFDEIKREFDRFYSQSCFLKEKIGVLDDKKRHDLDTEMWIYRLRCNAATDYMTTGGLKRSTIELINSLPKKMRIDSFNQIGDAQKAIDWYLQHDQYKLPKDLPQLKLEESELISQLTFIPEN